MKNIIIIGACRSGKTEEIIKIAMKKMILVGGCPVGFHFAMHSISSVVKQQIEVAIIENKKQLEETKNRSFEPEPMILKNYHQEYIEPKIYNDIPRNKFFDKPKNNFRKR